MHDQIRAHDHIGRGDFFLFEMERSRIEALDHTVVEDVQTDGFRRLGRGLREGKRSYRGERQ
jgi:hypothetical protein